MVKTQTQEKNIKKDNKNSSQGNGPTLNVKKTQKKIIKIKTKDVPSTRFKKTVELFRNDKEYFQLDDRLENCGFSTKAIHSGNNPDPLNGGVVPSIDLSSTFAQPAPGEPSSCFDYARCGNPTVLALRRNLASLEGAKYAFACSTGMSAIVTICSLLKQGDHLLCIDDLYSGFQRYLRNVFTPHTGIPWDMIDFTDLKKVRDAFKPNTRMVWIESPTNPTLKVTDIAAVAKICKGKGALLVVDNTFMSPVLQSPLKLGADIVMHSLTKYVSGHCDVLAGAFMFNDDELYDKYHYIIKTVGSAISPFEAFLCMRGSKTLKLRAEKASENALQIAKWLESHPKVDKVLYPGLPSHPQYQAALNNRSNPKTQSGGSGMVSMYIKGDIKKANKLLSSLKLFTLAESLGGVASLIESPALMTHQSVPESHRQFLGIGGNFIRISVGVEDVEDLINDLSQAFDQI